MDHFYASPFIWKYTPTPSQIIVSIIWFKVILCSIEECFDQKLCVPKKKSPNLLAKNLKKSWEKTEFSEQNLIFILCSLHEQWFNLKLLSSSDSCLPDASLIHQHQPTNLATEKTPSRHCEQILILVYSSNRHKGWNWYWVARGCNRFSKFNMFLNCVCF